MADALLVFNPLQGDCLFVCALSILISMDVTPLLRRRLYGLQEARFAFAFAQVSTGPCWLVPQYASSLRFFFCVLCATYPLTGSPHTSLTMLPLSPFGGGCFLLVSASCVASPRTYRLSMMPLWLPSAPSTQDQVASPLGAKQCSRPV